MSAPELFLSATSHGYTQAEVDRWAVDFAEAVNRFGGRHKITVLPPQEVTHACPPDGGDGLMPCCGRTPFEVSRLDRLTVHEDMVTCKGPGEEAAGG